MVHDSWLLCMHDHEQVHTHARTGKRGKCTVVAKVDDAATQQNDDLVEETEGLV